MLVGNKYGRQHRAEQRRADSMANAGVEEGSWEAPSEADCDNVEEVNYPIGETGRIVVHWRYRQGRIVFFMIQHEILHEGEWWPVARIDCKHRSVHLHRYRMGGTEVGSRTTLTPLHSEEDVDAAWDDSYSLIADNAEEHERTWRNV